MSYVRNSRSKAGDAIVHDRAPAVLPCTVESLEAA